MRAPVSRIVIAVGAALILGSAGLAIYVIALGPQELLSTGLHKPTSDQTLQEAPSPSAREVAREKLLAVMRETQSAPLDTDRQTSMQLAHGPETPQRPQQQSQLQTAESAEQRLAIPDQSTLIILIRTAIIALNQANKTNDYSVLHALGAPGFQQANSPERLSELFSALRDRDLDVGPIVVIPPNLFREPSIDNRGRLRLTGFFPSRPEQVNFDLAFEMVEGEWRLFGIGVNTSRIEARP
jgi:hypothetical protein